MTFELTSERLQEIAVNCVTQFIQKQASLNESIAKEAMDLELNAEQTKRVIEASNTIAYLRQLEKSADRTFEFEVADYGKVMANMTLPDDMRKTASEEDDKEVKKDLDIARAALDEAEKDQDKDDKDDKKEDKKSDDKDDKKKDEKSDKEESKDDEKDEDSDEDKQEKKAMLMKGYFHAKETLEKMAYDEAAICLELSKAASVVFKDPDAFEKIAHVVDSQDLDKTLTLCGIEKRAQQDVVVTDAELADVKHMYSVYKQACEFITKKAELRDFVERAETVLFKTPVDLEKQAFIGGLLARGAGAIAKGIGSLAGSAAAGAGKGIANMAGNIGSFGRAASKAGYKSTADAVSAYDKIKGTQGLAAAQAQFNGKKPSFLVHRVGLGGAMTAATGLGMTHQNNVKDI